MGQILFEEDRCEEVKRKGEDWLDSESFVLSLKKRSGQAARGHLLAGRPIYYGDPRYPNHIVKKFPDGRKEYIAIDGHY